MQLTRFLGGEKCENGEEIAAAALLPCKWQVWWTVFALVLTCSAPFSHSGNGYFSCWLAAGVSIHLANYLNTATEAGVLRSSVQWAHAKAF